MESSFTKFPEPVGDTETSWKDNVNFESEYAKKWAGDDKLSLPKRTAPGRYPHYPDYNDADFDVNSSEGTYCLKNVLHQRCSLDRKSSRRCSR